jgi:hypothetical protein
MGDFGNNLDSMVGTPSQGWQGRAVKRGITTLPFF